MPPPPPLPPTSIRVKLPPSSSRPAAAATVSSSSSGTPQASSSSSIFERASLKKQDANQSVKIPSYSSSTPSTPRKKTTLNPASSGAVPRNARPYTPSRRNPPRYKNAPPPPPPSSESVSLFLRDNQKSPTPVKKASLPLSSSNAKVLSLSSSVSSNKGTNNDKKKEKKIVNSDGTSSPTSSSSSSSSSIRIVGENRRTRNSGKKKDIKPLSYIKNNLGNEKVDDPLIYQDPLLFSTSTSSSSSSTTFTSSIPSSSASSNTEISSSAVAEVKRNHKDDDEFEDENDDPFLIVKKKKNVGNHNVGIQDENKAKENLLPLLLLHGQKEKDEEGNNTSFENWMTMTSKGFDDSGCEIEWEGEDLFFFHHIFQSHLLACFF